MYHKPREGDVEEEESPTPAHPMDIIHEAPSESDRDSVGDDPSRQVSKSVSAAGLKGDRSRQANSVPNLLTLPTNQRDGAYHVLLDSLNASSLPSDR